MTVQELINKLSEIEDKSMDVYKSNDGGPMSYLCDFYIYDDYIELW